MYLDVKLRRQREHVQGDTRVLAVPKGSGSDCSKATGLTDYKHLGGSLGWGGGGAELKLKASSTVKAVA